MDTTQGLAAILRDARKGRAPQDEVGDTTSQDEDIYFPDGEEARQRRLEP
jgi:hypothetical protein